MIRSLCLSASVLFSLLYPSIAQALMPPEHYAERARSSDIKAIAVILSVDTLRIGNRFTEKLVRFEVDFALSATPNKVVTGTCKSVDTPQQKANIMVGGEIYLYPVPGQRVFVTVSREGGAITSLTPMSKALEQVIREEPERLRYGIAKVGIDKGNGD